MKNLLFHLLLIGCLVGVPGYALAQNTNEASSDENYSGSSRKTMRVIAFRSPSDEAGDDLDALFYEYKGKKIPFHAPINYLSSSMPMPKGESMHIYQEVQLPVEGSTKTEAGYKIVGTVPLVSGSRGILIIFIPPDLAKNKIRGRAFKDSNSIHPKETARVFNMSPKVAAISAGKEALKVPVGGEGILRWKAVAFNSISYQIGTEGKKPGTWKVIERTECLAPDDSRTFVFVIGAEFEDEKTITTLTCLDPIYEEDEDAP